MSGASAHARILAGLILASGCSVETAADRSADGSSSGNETTSTSSTTSGPGASTSGSTSPTDSTSGPDSGTSADPVGTDSSTGSFPQPTPDECITDVSAGHHVFECSGLDFDVEVPEDCLETACGMVVDIHGLSMDAQIQDANTGLRALGRDHGYIVVQPNGQQGLLGLQWEPADDAKVFDFMQRVAAAWNVDDRRWHVTGFSQGGLMSWRLLCEHADALASLAPAGGCGTSAANGCPFVGADVPSDPVDVLYLHGVQDALVSFNCFAPKRDAVISHYELAEGEPVSSDDDYRWIRYAGTAATFETIDHDYQASSPILAGHCIPGSQDDGGAPGQLMSYGCVGPNAVSWGETVMQFFIDHPRD